MCIVQGRWMNCKYCHKFWPLGICLDKCLFYVGPEPELEQDKLGIDCCDYNTHWDYQCRNGWYTCDDCRLDGIRGNYVDENEIHFHDPVPPERREQGVTDQEVDLVLRWLSATRQQMVNGNTIRSRGGFVYLRGVAQTATFSNQNISNHTREGPRHEIENLILINDIQVNWRDLPGLARAGGDRPGAVQRLSGPPGRSHEIGILGEDDDEEMRRNRDGTDRGTRNRQGR